MQGDYYVLESVFKGNFLMKDEMRRAVTEGLSRQE